ncbi:hypothetical protein EBZ39_00135 [bacterium]|nr:hypothetical protein [bacterium]
MVSILENASVITNGRAELVFEGQSVKELMDASTANLAIQKAAELGLHRPGVSSASGPYPVDENGKTDDELLLGKRGPITGYRRDFVILASI